MSRCGQKHRIGCQTELDSNPAKPCFPHLQNGEDDNNASLIELV